MKRYGLIFLLCLFANTVYAADMTSSAAIRAEEPFSEPWFTGNKVHQYLGLGSLALGVLTAIVPKPEEDNYDGSLHQGLAYGATYLGGAALASGLVFHYKDLSFKHLLRNPDNLHALLATIATAGFITAVSIAPDEAHATAGIIGVAGMATAIKITW